MASKKPKKRERPAEKPGAGKISRPADGPSEREADAVAEPSQPREATPSLPFPVAGLCASAGGLDAFKKFFAAMPADSGIAYVLLPHLDPHHESLMVELIARHTTMPVAEAIDGTSVAANHVYVIPPNKYITIDGGVLRLSGPVDRWTTSFDLFLRSLALEQQEKAVGIFFRDPEAWYSLQTQVVTPLVQAREGDRPIRVWVPGSATGEEPYALGMLFLEQLAAAHKNCPVQVFATDVDEQSLELGRQGIYPDSIRTDVVPERLARFFAKINDRSYQVNKQLRDTVVFAVQNLIVDAPFSRLDLISCRNLFIYLEPDVQKKVLALFHYALNVGGYLFLGPSETIGQHVDLFEPVNKKWRIYRRIGVGPSERVDFPIVSSDRQPTPTRSASEASLALRVGAVGSALYGSRGRPVNFGELTQRFLLETYAPASVLINRKNEVLYFHGPTKRFLDQPTGEPTLDLLMLVREGLRSKVRTAVSRAVHDNQPVEERGGRLKDNGSYVAVAVSVRPLRGSRTPEGLLLVTFEEEQPPPPARPEAPVAAADEPLVRQLENDLKATREDLQSSVEDLEYSNQELKAANKEVMSMNEELQSANEELETSKEELQSLNEVNSQLVDKVDELEGANNDITNLLNCIDVATIFLDTQFRIKRFTQSATRLFNLIDTDIGRPLDDISRKFADAGLRADTEEVLRSFRPREREIKTEQGTWYFRRIVPYRTADRSLEGVVLTFVNLSVPKLAETALRDSEQRLRGLNKSLEERVAERTRELREKEELMRSIVDTAAEGIVVTDETGVISSFNKAAEQMFGYAAAEAIGQSVNVLLPVPVHAEQDHYFASLQSAGIRKTIGLGREVVGRRKDGSTFPIDVAVSELSDGSKRLFTGIIRDISQRRTLEKEVLEIAAQEQRRIGQDLHDSVGQEITGLRLMAENLAESLTGPSEKKQAQRISAGLQEALRQIRALSRGLIPVEVGPDGLMTALTDLAERVSDQSGVACSFRCDRPVLLKDPQTATQLFRIAQEAITNALLHGRARNILIRLTADDLLTLVVEDDGIGLSERKPPTTGSGLKSMSYRAGLINAVLDVGPREDGGTRVTCTLKMGMIHDQKTKPAKKRR